MSTIKIRNPFPMSSSDPSSVHTISTLKNVSELTGRIFLGLIFLVAGIGKISGYAATAGYMESVGVPSALLPLVIATEVLGAIAIMVGWQTRITAILLAGFTVIAALIFHNNLADQMQQIMFMKNIAIAGGFLILVAQGAGDYSLDHRIANHKPA